MLRRERSDRLEACRRTLIKFRVTASHYTGRSPMQVVRSM